MALGLLVVCAAPALAQVTAEPSSAGLPGAALVSKIIGWLAWIALMACLGAVLFGAAMWRGAARTGNYSHAADGKQYVIGGLIGALLAGLAPTAINTFFSAGRAGG
jgi:hypothetical protein